MAEAMMFVIKEWKNLISQAMYWLWSNEISFIGDYWRKKKDGHEQ